MSLSVEGKLRPESDVISDLETSLRVVIDREEEPVTEAEIRSTVDGLEREKQDVVRGLFESVTHVGELAGWPEALLLDRIGCKHRKEEDLAALPIERLRNCARFLELLQEAAETVETVPSRRAAIMTFADLIRQTGQEPDGLATLLEVGDPSPWEYVGLGEIAQAARVVRINARVERPEDRDPQGPFKVSQRVHISTPRLDAFIRGERDVLGHEVYKRIGEHVASCKACGAAADYRRGRLIA